MQLKRLFFFNHCIRRQIGTFSPLNACLWIHRISIKSTLLASKLTCCRWTRRNSWDRSRFLVYFYFLHVKWKIEMREIPRGGSRGGNSGRNWKYKYWPGVGISSRRARKTLFPRPSAGLSPSIRCPQVWNWNFKNIFSKTVANSDDHFDSLVIRGEKDDFPAVSNHSYHVISSWFLWRRNFLTFGGSKRSFRKPTLKLQQFERSHGLLFNQS